MNIQELSVEQRKHLKIIDFIIKSAPAVWFVALQAWKHDHPVRIGPLRVAKTLADIKKFSDSGDLEIDYGGAWKCMEVKHITSNFTNKDNWPFGKKFIVDRIETYDSKKHKVYGYMIVSSDYKGMAFVNVAETRNKWVKDNEVNTMYGEGIPAKQETYYYCPFDLVKWVPII